METRWRGTVIVDYEIGLPDRAVLEWELYSQGLLRVPAVLLDAPGAWGRQRRPGIVDLPEVGYDAVTVRITERLLDLEAVRGLAAHVDRLLAAVGDRLSVTEDHLDEAAAEEVADLVEGLCRVMALHVVNWMWPIGTFEHIAATVLGDADLGHRAVLSLLVPAAPAHMLDFHQHVLTALEQTATDPGQARAVAEQLAGNVGFLHRPAMPGLAPQPWERPGIAVGVLACWAARTDTTVLAEQREALRAAHERAQADRRAMYAALLAAASGDPPRWRQVQAIAVACRIAADAEERRKVLQMRFLRLARILAQRHGLAPAQVTLTDLVGAVALAATAGPGC